MPYNIIQRFQEASEQYPRQTAIQWKKDGSWKEVSYSELSVNVALLTEYLVKLDIKKGDRIAIKLENRPEWSMIFFSSVDLGAICVPLNPEANQTDVLNILKDCTPKVVFTNDESFLSGKDILQKLPFLKSVVSVDSAEFQETAGFQPHQLQ